MNLSKPSSRTTALPTHPLHKRALLLAALMGVHLSLPWQAVWAAPPNEPTKIADQPLAALSGVPANVLLALSVEFPTAVSNAHIDPHAAPNAQLDTSYDNSKKYVGYFDERKCYVYDGAGEFFRPAALASANAACVGQWSGNFMNWATMQTIDTFRMALTGGYRAVDTASETMLEKALASGQGGGNGYNNFPIKEITGLGLVQSSTSFDTSSNPSRARVRVKGLGSYIYITRHAAGTPQGDAMKNASDDTSNANNPPSGSYKLRIRVKVCDPTAPGGVESNCTRYPHGNYKPTGLLQSNSQQMRFGVTGFLADNNTGHIKRDGGVLRARMASLGPLMPLTGGPNPNAEWNIETGVFNSNPASADASLSAVTNSGAINYLNKFGLTAKAYKHFDPIGELYYESLRYLQGQAAPTPGYADLNAFSATPADKVRYKDGFPVITNWTDPVQYQCQKNIILGIGDVNTHSDRNLPGNTSTSLNLPYLLSNEGDHHPSSSDANGFDLANELEYIRANEGGTFSNVFAQAMGTNTGSPSVAALASFARRTDQRPTLAQDQKVSTFWVDVLEYQTYKHKNQYWLATKYGGFKDKDLTPGPNLENEWRSKGRTYRGNPIPDNYFVAANPDSVIKGLNEAFRDINELISSSAGLGLLTPNLTTAGSAAYGVSYDSSNWSGKLAAYSLQVGANGTVASNQQWEAGALLNARMAGGNVNARVIATATPSASGGGVAGIPFQMNALSAAQKTALGPDTTTQAKVLAFLRGVRGDEGSGGLRVRSSVLGDVVGSEAVVVDKSTARYSEALNPGFANFANDNQTRATTVYVGANDGMLHAFDGTLSGAGAGQERWAYVPSALFGGPHGDPADSGLQALALSGYAHRAYVDSTPVVRDVDFSRTVGAPSPEPSDSDWRTILVGGLGKGGRSYYALDVTRPESLTSETQLADKVLWEFSDPDMGYSMGKPRIFKTTQHGWVVALTSGYNNTQGANAGQGFIYLLNARTGELIQKIGTGVGTPASPSGLAHAAAYIPALADYTADSIYAGDLEGNLWRFDLRATSGNYPPPVRLAQLRTTAGNQPQPVTTEPEVSADPATQVRYVFVGTGRSLHPDDRLTVAQTFYSFVDGTRDAMGTAPTTPLGKSDLAALTSLTDGVVAPPNGRGWFYDLPTTVDNFNSRVDVAPAANGGTVAFAANTPSSDPCSPMTGRVYVVTYGSGKSVLQSVQADGTVTPMQWVSVPRAITKLQRISSSGHTRTLISTSESPLATDEGGAPGGVRRLNWREVTTR